MSMKLYIDIETKCALGCEVKCDHALQHNSADISCVGIAVEDVSDGHVLLEYVARDLGDVRDILNDYPTAAIVGHGVIHFDVKVLRAKGIDLRDREIYDTQLEALAFTEKVSAEFLEWYEAERKRINKEQKRGHRKAKGYSLKTLHPYFCSGSCFWEVDDKDDDTYVMEDVRRTRELHHFLLPQIKAEGTYKFYREKLIPWSWTLHEAEWAGIHLDFDKIDELQAKAQAESEEAKEKLDALWQDGYRTFAALQQQQVREKYDGMLERSLLRLKPVTLKDPVKAAARTEEKFQRARRKNAELLRAALDKIKPFNIDSDDQMMWLLREFNAYDVRTLDAIQKEFEPETAQTHYVDKYSGEKVAIFSSGAEVLERLSAEGKEDCKLLLDYRGGAKLATSFFPSYRELQFNGRLHCNFNITGTRTGRTSSDSPNLQQVPGHLKQIFVPRPGHLLITRDMSGVEPIVIAYFTQDAALCETLISGANFHDDCTPIFFDEIDAERSQVKKLFPKERDCTKQCDLSILYGSGANMLRRTYLKHGFHRSKSYCREALARFRDRYEGVFHFKEEVLDPKLSRGEPITNILGRQFRLKPEEVHMRGLNTLVQSSASDLVLQSARKINDEFKAKGISGGVRLLVHDELVTEAEEGRIQEAEEIVERCMTNYRLPTPYGDLPLRVEGQTKRYWAK